MVVTKMHWIKCALLLLSITVPWTWTLGNRTETAIIAVLVDLHHPLSTSTVIENDNDTMTRHCGPLNLQAFEELAAVRWAIEIINNKSWPGEFGLDIVVRDTCGEKGQALSETEQLLLWNQETSDSLIGAIVIGSGNDEKVINGPLELLDDYNVSAIVTSSRGSSLLLKKHPNVFTTSPDISSVAEAIAALLHQLGSRTVGIISSNAAAIRKFRRVSVSKSVNSIHALLLGHDSPDIIRRVLLYLRKEAKSVDSIVLMLSYSELRTMLDWGRDEAVKEIRKLSLGKTWILGTVDATDEITTQWTSRFGSKLIIVQPHTTENPDFKAYFVGNIAEAVKHEPSEETKRYLTAVHNCQWSDSVLALDGVRNPIKSCNQLSAEDIDKRFHAQPETDYIVNALSAYSAALRLAQLDHCKDKEPCKLSVLKNDMIKGVKQLNFPSSIMPDGENEGAGDETVASNHELEGTRGRINYQGQLVGRKYDIRLKNLKSQVTQVGHYSSRDGLVMHIMLTMRHDRKLDYDDEIDGVEKIGRQEESGERLKSSEFFDDSVNMRRLMSPPEYYISRMWAMIAVAVATTGACTALYMLVYVLQRICDGTLQGSQILGILLLIGVEIMYSSVILFVLPPSHVFCTLRMFLPSLATTVCFAILLLKAMNLRSYAALGVGGKIPILNQFITICFIVGVQMALDVQWFMTSESYESDVSLQNDDRDQLFTQCAYKPTNYLYLHGYLGILIFIVFLYGISVLKIKQNHNEARWITLASMLSIPIAVAWTLIVHLGPDHIQEAAACITFLATATIILFSIFVPKLSTISHHSSLMKRKKLLSLGAPNCSGSISTIFTNVSDPGTLQSQLSRHKYGNSKSSNHSLASNNIWPPYISPRQYMAPPNFSGHNQPSIKSVTYSPRLTTNFFEPSSPSTSLPRSVSMKTPFITSGKSNYY